MARDIHDIDNIRNDFAFFKESKVAYLDNSATSQRPECVIEAEADFYRYTNANPMRGLYDLSVKATDRYENARAKVAGFINAESPDEIIFTRNASESLNLAAFSLGELLVGEGDEILVGIMEHHSNSLPWRHMAERKGATLKYLECDPDGFISEERFKSALSSKTKIVALTHVSNVFGRENDIKTFSKLAHEAGAVFVCDGAQSVPHMRVDVRDLDVDFLAFSGHKMLAPMGIGVLYGKMELLEKMPPFLTGGEMIDMVTVDRIVYAPIPHKFEAGTVNAGAAHALSAAIDYIESIGFDFIEEREELLTKYALEKMKDIPHVKVIGSDDYKEHHGIITFDIEGVHPHDIAAIFDSEDIAVRAGHHCAQPLLRFLGYYSTTRASFAFYNTEEEVDRFIECLKTIRGKMGYGD